MTKILHHSVQLNCDAHLAFEMFTVNKLLQSWFTKLADVEPVGGGKYELFWDPEDRENNSTIGCKITAIEQDKLLSFDWKGPVQYKHFMNNADPLTQVVVSFFPCGDGADPCTEVHIIHTGWRNSSEWEEARMFFEKAWSNVLKELRKAVNEYNT
ncbi:MAG: SRPBCC domain-containing protein [bacterium]|nr:MAG: SRPBCC domain-containing protein [bacterium]